MLDQFYVEKHFLLLEKMKMRCIYYITGADDDNNKMKRKEESIK